MLADSTSREQHRLRRLIRDPMCTGVCVCVCTQSDRSCVTHTATMRAGVVTFVEPACICSRQPRQQANNGMPLAAGVTPNIRFSFDPARCRLYDHARERNVFSARVRDAVTPHLGSKHKRPRRLHQVQSIRSKIR